MDSRLKTTANLAIMDFVDEFNQIYIHPESWQRTSSSIKNETSTALIYDQRDAQAMLIKQETQLF